MTEMLKKVVAGSILFLVWLSVSWSILNPNFFQVHDYLHAARAAEMARAIQDGQLPPRWSENFNYGYGMPLFEFYGPLPSYMGAVLYFLGFSPVMNVKIMMLTIVGFGMWGAFKLGRYLYGYWPGVLTAAIFTLAPYKSLNVLIRGALNETAGLNALPWVMLGSMMILDRSKHGKIITIIGLTVLFLSHNITTLIALPISLFWILITGFLRQKNGELKQYLMRLIELAKTYALSLAISAFYLFPAFLEKDLTQVSELITTKYFQYHLHFLYIRQFFDSSWGYGGSEWGPDDKISFFLGWGQWFVILLSVIYLIKAGIKLLKGSKKPHHIRADIYSGTLNLSLIGVALLMTTFKSSWVWTNLSLLEFVQFPWRFLGVVLLFISVLTGWLFNQAPSRWKPLLFVLILIGSIMNAQYFKPEKYLDETKGLYFYESDRIKDELSGALPDYTPAQIHPEIWRTPSDENIFTCNFEEACPFTSEVILDISHQKLVNIERVAPGEHQVELSIANYPGWIVELDGQEISTYSSEKGLLTFNLTDVSDGKHLVGARLGQTDVRRYSDLVSGLAILFTISSLSFKNSKVLRE